MISDDDGAWDPFFNPSRIDGIETGNSLHSKAAAIP
jgi:hypothetical protein